MENKNVFEETVKTLIDDAIALTNKYHKIVSKNDRESTRDAIDTLRLLKDTLSLIKEYDWKLEYSEHSIDGDKQIALWEQNHSGDIRNYKVWDVADKNKMSYNKWKDLLRTFIENKQSMIFELSYDKNAQKEHRGTGKTTAIENLAIEYDLPLLTNRYRAKEYNKKMDFRQYEDKNSRAYSNYGTFQFDIPVEKSVVLVDEGFIDAEKYKDLNNKCILIGFKSV